MAGALPEVTTERSLKRLSHMVWSAKATNSFGVVSGYA